MAQIDEIAPDTFRISIHVPQFDLQFNHFLVRDEEPLRASAPRAGSAVAADAPLQHRVTL